MIQQKTYLSLLFFFISSFFIVYVKSVDTVTYIPYQDDTFNLAGYIALPYVNTTSSRYPTVIIIPDADSVSQYEVKRARLLADYGYIGFAADIFGADKHELQNATERTNLINYYRSNPYIFVKRIQAAVDKMRSRSDVDGSKIVIIGYCFGGTGVINYAISGGNVSGVVSFHGGLTQRLAANMSSLIPAKIVLYSGGSDDVNSEITELEDELNLSNATWEITRFSGVRHAFTVWNDTRYHPRADERSWAGMLLFMTEVFSPSNTAVQPTGPIPGPNPTFASVNYTHEDADLEGYEVVPTTNLSKVPAVIIIGDWDGVNDYEIQRARLIASEFKYYAFAADIFGAEYHNVTNTTERIALTSLYRNNISLFVGRIQAAVDVVKSRPMVDPTKIVVIGYCFGGTGVINFAITGGQVAGVVSFHGTLTLRANATSLSNITASMLVESGGSDDPSSEIKELEDELNLSNATWEISRYSRVVHGFTIWSQATAFNPRADYRSWRSTQGFLIKVFGSPFSGSIPPADIVLPKPSNVSTTSQSTTTQASTTDQVINTTSTSNQSTTSDTPPPVTPAPKDASTAFSLTINLSLLFFIFALLFLN